MQFDITGFLIFLAFILPGFVAQKARDSITPRTLKPQSAVSEVGEFVLAGILSHIFLILIFCGYFQFFQKSFFAIFQNTLHYGSLPNFLWNYRPFLLAYFVLSLATGYIVGGVQGYLILRQPVRSWLLNKRPLTVVLERLGIPGFLKNDPVWYFVFQQRAPGTQVFLDIEMRDSGGFYTGELMSYGIVDDSEENKDFYIARVNFKADRAAEYAPLPCDGLLLNFKNVLSMQVVKIPPDPKTRVLEIENVGSPERPEPGVRAAHPSG
jgi:hypothetical protein